jgi:tetratricopeptide (TPR) repeat protein
LTEARAGRGSVALVEAPAGQGKTALLRASRSAAQAAGLRVLTATGVELQRDFAYGVVRQLFESVVTGEVLSGAAELAAPIFSNKAHEDGPDAAHARIHGLFWLCANLAEREPLVLVVDDAHWADPPSLRFLDVLARRVQDIAALIAIATRPDEPGAEQALLDGLLEVPATQILRPAPLSPEAIAHLTADALGREPDPAFAKAAAESTGGNALFVRELLRAAADDGLSGTAQEVRAIQSVAPETLTRMVAARLRRLPDEARAVARAVAVLGHLTTIARVCRLTGITREAALVGADTLARTALLEPDRLAFAHPIVREAVHAGLAGAEIRAWHGAAARLLADATSDDEIAMHLLAAEPEGDPWAAAVLARAGRRALADGAPDVAQCLLGRALEEPPDEASRPEVLLALGMAEARTGAPSAIDHLEAAAGHGDPAIVAHAVSVIAYVLTAREELPRGAELLRRTLERDDLPAEWRGRLEDDHLHALWYADGAIEEYQRLAKAGAAGRRSAALAHVAADLAYTGAPCDEVLIELRTALADGSLIRQLARESYTCYHAIEALHVIEAADEADAVLRDAEAAIRRGGSPFMLATLAYMRPTWARLFGDLRRAEGPCRDAVELFGAAGAAGGHFVAAVGLATVLLDRGEIDEADSLLATLADTEQGLGIIGVHAARAWVHVERGRWQQAVEEAERHYALERPRGHLIWPRTHLRVLHVRALLGLSRREDALAYADAEVELHARRGARGHEAMAHLSRAYALDGDEAIAELRTAATCAAASPMRLAEARVLAELGGRLRRAGRRTEAREPLRQAQDLARRAGATGPENHAREEPSPGRAPSASPWPASTRSRRPSGASPTWPLEA